MYRSRSGYYWMYFIFILFIFSYIGFYVAEQYYLWSAFIGILFGVMVFFLALIPFTDYLANRLSRFTEEKELHAKGAFKFVLAFIVILPLALIAFSLFDEFGEKNLTKALSYVPGDVETVEFMSDGNAGVWQNSSKEAAAELHDFFGQYEVKKMSDSDWDSDVSKETGLMLTLHMKNHIIIAYIYENRMHLLNDGNYYSVMNGPIDMEWVAEYNERYN
ncbi:hypothetical protein [Metaplanococcus flavidus]|uniref:Uncharacterized protein n=1 Tax=Metaplanococcus flavidus TaxID=569883 RepID=A0ABW3L7D8_9BACL